MMHLKTFEYICLWLMELSRRLVAIILGPRMPQILTANYHYLRECPYTCQYCFYPNTNRDYLPLQEAREGLRLLRKYGFNKITFSGGEPFVHPRHLAEMMEYCKRDLRFPAVSVVTNGALVTEKWMKNHAWAVDIMTVSCDSFDNETNLRIGRSKSPSDAKHVERVYNLKRMCKEYSVAFKLNTTVSAVNVDEDMSEHIASLAPDRWKVFQCLPVPGENCGEGAPRDASDLFINDEQFQAFLRRHKGLCEATVPEPNELMRNSYCIIDQNMCILRNNDESKVPTRSILDVGVAAALEEAKLDAEAFHARGGDYTISRPQCSAKELPEW